SECDRCCGSWRLPFVSSSSRAAYHPYVGAASGSPKRDRPQRTPDPPSSDRSGDRRAEKAAVERFRERLRLALDLEIDPADRDPRPRHEAEGDRLETGAV